MNKLKFFLIWTLIFIFLFNSVVFTALGKVKAEGETYTPWFNWWVAAVVDPDKSGNINADLRLNWGPPDNIASYKDNNGHFIATENPLRLGWVININGNGDHKLVCKRYDERSGSFSKKEKIGWNNTYSVTIDLRIFTGDSCGAASGGGTTIPGGEVSHPVVIGPPPVQNGGGTATGNCPTQNIKYAFNSTTSITFSWAWDTAPSCSYWLSSGSNRHTLTIVRPDGSTVARTIHSDVNIQNDSNAQTGKYLFKTYANDSVPETGSPETGTPDGLTTAMVDLSKYTPPSGGTTDPAHSPGSSGSDTGTGDYSECEKGCPAGYLFNLIPSIQSVFCQMQCALMDFIALILSSIINNILIPSLGN